MQPYLNYQNVKQDRSNDTVNLNGSLILLSKTGTNPYTLDNNNGSTGYSGLCVHDGSLDNLSQFKHRISCQKTSCLSVRTIDGSGFDQILQCRDSGGVAFSVECEQTLNFQPLVSISDNVVSNPWTFNANNSTGYKQTVLHDASTTNFGNTGTFRHVISAVKGNILHVHTNMTAGGGDHDPQQKLFLVSLGTIGSESRRFVVLGSGVGEFAGAVNSGLGDDYAEMYEWEDGNPEIEEDIIINDDNEENNIEIGPLNKIESELIKLKKDRHGIVVTFREGTNKIKVCEEHEIPIGVSKPNESSGFTCGSSPLEWKNRFLKDEWGKNIKTDDNLYIQNPLYDPKIIYIPRRERREWANVGLVGICPILNGQIIPKHWIRMNQLNDNLTNYFVK